MTAEFAFCACDCNERVGSAKSMFRPGHDSKMVSRLTRKWVVAYSSGDNAAVFAIEQSAKAYSPALQGKIHTAFSKAKPTAVRRALRRQREMAAAVDMVQ